MLEDLLDCLPQSGIGIGVFGGLSRLFSSLKPARPRLEPWPQLAPHALGQAPAALTHCLADFFSRALGSFVAAGPE